MIALVDYGAGNLHSVANALTHLRLKYEITADPETVRSSDRVIFPGVGAASSCMEELRKRGLDEALRSCRQPLLGVCLGMQVLTERSAEGLQEVQCLGAVPGHTARFEAVEKLPQIGWNTVRQAREDPIFAGIPQEEYFYFAHSYRVHVPPESVIGETDYGGPYPSVVRHENFRGVQFHPEKSGPHGLRILRNFAERC